MIRPNLVLAMAFYANLTASAAWCASPAQKAAPPPKSGWSTMEAPSYDPAYAAYDSGRYEAALKHVTEVASKGEVQANPLLGLLYERGRGVRQDEAKAVEWYTKGALAGDKHAQFHLGVMLGQGRGVKKDPKKAADFFEAAAKQDH